LHCSVCDEPGFNIFTTPVLAELTFKTDGLDVALSYTSLKPEPQLSDAKKDKHAKYGGPNSEDKAVKAAYWAGLADNLQAAQECSDAAARARVRLCNKRGCSGCEGKVHGDCPWRCDFNDIGKKRAPPPPEPNWGTGEVGVGVGCASCSRNSSSHNCSRNYSGL
jgi:hypothetical protein